MHSDTDRTAGEPAAYPWPPLQKSCMVTADAIVPVDMDGTGNHWAAIDAHLAAAGATPLSQRNAILAIGSNRSLTALRRKYTRIPGWIIPTLNATVAGIGVGHAACVSGPGWIPWAPLAADTNQRFRYSVSFLDEVELALLDRTEPNYLRRPVPTVHTVELENGEMLDNVHLYRSRHGLIGSEDGDPVPAGPQHDALPIAAAALGRPVTHAQFAASADLRNELRAALADSAVKDGMDTSSTVAAP